MRTTKPRIEPVQDGEWTEEQEQLLKPFAREGGLIPNVYRTLARHPSAMRAFIAWGGHILRGGNTLPERERELLILRTGWLCRAGYEWVAHIRVAKRVGVTDEEIDRVRAGSSVPGWAAADKTLIQVAEDMYADHFVSDSVWAVLRSHFREEQCMDAVYTVTQYTQVAMLLNSFGVQLDASWSLSDSDRKQMRL